MINKATKADWIDNEYNKADNATKTQLRLNWKCGLTDMIFTLSSDEILSVRYRCAWHY